MSIETILISGASAFLGTLGAISFQYWRENSQWQRKGNALISQLISLVQHNRLVVEVFDENHKLFTGAGVFQTPSPPPKSLISSSLLVDVAEHINKKEFEILSTAISSYDSFYMHTNQMRDYHSEVETRMVKTLAPNPMPLEIINLKKHSRNYKGILKTNMDICNKTQELLEKTLKERENNIFDSDYALTNKPTLLLLYVVAVSYIALVFSYLYFTSKGA